MNLGGVDGLIHITDLSWSRINHPSEIVELDAKINVVILDFDEDKSRIQLGLKQLSKHPWEALSDDVKVGDKVKGKVVVIADYGAFIELAEGVEEDKKKRESVDTKNQADSLINETEKNLKEHGDKVPEEDKNKITASMSSPSLTFFNSSMSAVILFLSSSGTL